METKRLMTRREFIRLTTLAGAGVVVAACAPAPTVAPTGAPAATKAPEATKPPEAPKATQPPAATLPPPTKFKEAPMLEKLVKEGKLPPVEKRLPDNPWVVPTLQAIGKHGGMIRRAYNGISDRTGTNKFVDRGLIWFDKNLAVTPRIAESWSVTPDGKEWTFKLRKGSKWSDGHDFSTADVKWYYDNQRMNKTLTATTSQGIWFDTKASPVAKLEIVDAVTFKLKYTEPKPLLILQLGRSHVGGVFSPGHYMKEFHIDLTSDKAKLDAEVKAKGLKTWTDLFDLKQTMTSNPDLPFMGGWVTKQGEEIGKDVFNIVRNPYFIGVDSAGNQLPYLDQVRFRLFQDANVFKLWVTNGEIDFQVRHIPSTASDYTLFKQSEAKGDYKILKGSNANHVAYQLNLATKNDKLREFFNVRKVRIALSLAINRDQINELLYGGLAVPRQYSPVKASPQYYEKLTKAYVKFDVAEANKLLDEAGYKNKDANGIRTYKDGTPITFTIEGTDNVGSPQEDASQQIVKMWAKVGVKAAYKYVERSLYSQHYTANEIEAASWGGDRTVLPLAADAIIFRGVQPDRPWSAGFNYWYRNPELPAAMKPPEGHFIWKIWEIWDKLAVEVSEAKQNELFRQILDIWAEELPMIGVVGELPSFCIVKNGFKNFIDGFPWDDTTGDEHIYNTETYFWEDPSKYPAL